MEPITPPRHMKSWSSSGEQIAGNKDILSKILFLLPASTVVRFKSVGWQWLCLISESWFCAEHIRHNPKPSVSGLFYGSYPIHFKGHPIPTLDFIDLPKIQGKALIHDSANGLVLCSHGIYTFATSDIIVCNPTTQRYKRLEKWGLRDIWWAWRSHLHLYFNPSLSPVYKVILVTYQDEDFYYNVSIYTSDRSTWKTIPLEAQQVWGRIAMRGFLSTDGVIHMLTTKFYHVQFEIATEQISGALTAFTPKKTDGEIEYFGEQDNGNLILVVAKSSTFSYHITVYEMDKQEGQNWILKYHTDIAQNLQISGYMSLPIFYTCPKLAWYHFHGTSEERDMTFVLGVNGEVISYNLKSKETDVLCDLPITVCHIVKHTNQGTTFCNVHPYVISLAPV